MVDVKLFKNKVKNLPVGELVSLQERLYTEIGKAMKRADDFITQTAWSNAAREFESAAEYSHKLYVVSVRIREINETIVETFADNSYTR